MSVGHIYAFVTKDMPDLVKIGMTTRDVETRLREANASNTWKPPSPYTVLCSRRVVDPAAKEKAIHRLLDDARENDKREFFRISRDKTLALFSLVDNISMTPDEKRMAALVADAVCAKLSSIGEEVTNYNNANLADTFTVGTQNDDVQKITDDKQVTTAIPTIANQMAITLRDNMAELDDPPVIPTCPATPIGIVGQTDLVAEYIDYDNQKITDCVWTANMLKVKIDNTIIASIPMTLPHISGTEMASMVYDAVAGKYLHMWHPYSVIIYRYIRTVDSYLVDLALENAVLTATLKKCNDQSVHCHTDHLRAPEDLDLIHLLVSPITGGDCGSVLACTRSYDRRLYDMFKIESYQDGRICTLLTTVNRKEVWKYICINSRAGDGVWCVKYINPASDKTARVDPLSIPKKTNESEPNKSTQVNAASSDSSSYTSEYDSSEDVDKPLPSAQDNQVLVTQEQIIEDKWEGVNIVIISAHGSQLVFNNNMRYWRGEKLGDFLDLAIQGHFVPKSAYTLLWKFRFGKKIPTCRYSVCQIGDTLTINLVRVLNKEGHITEIHFIAARGDTRSIQDITNNGLAKSKMIVVSTFDKLNNSWLGTLMTPECNSEGSVIAYRARKVFDSDWDNNFASLVRRTSFSILESNLCEYISSITNSLSSICYLT